MLRSRVFRLSALLAVPALAAVAIAQDGEAPAPLETDVQKWSYAIGQNVAHDLKQGGVEVDGEALLRGLRDGYAGEQALTDEQVNEALASLRTTMQGNQARIAEEQAAANVAAGQAYLEENKTKEGVITLESGLQYKVITEGDGPIPTASNRVSVHYRGTLIDGTEFDSSYSRGQPATFPVTGVIQGWVEALQLMKVGSKWELTIPSDLAYGANPRPGGPIGPNAVLVFEVELLSIE